MARRKRRNSSQREESIFEVVTPDMVAKFNRHLQESYGTQVDEDADSDQWNSVSALRELEITETERISDLRLLRVLAKKQPNVIQALRLYRSYVLGRGFDVRLTLREPQKALTDAQRKTVRSAAFSWAEFLRANNKSWTVREFGKRIWRDGEQFSVKADDSWPPKIRFIDPELIGDPAGEPEQKGIVTSPDDASVVLKYLQIHPRERTLVKDYTPDEMFHSKIDVDSTEKRGVSRFYPVKWSANKLITFLANEIDHRLLQSSIVLQRKVKGGPSRVASVLDNAKSGTTNYPEGSRRRETFRRGSIVSTNESVELVFCQPDSNFSDASPLGRWMVLQIAAATGWPYYAISADSADSNFASSLVQESPVVLMVEDEQDYFAGELRPICEWVLRRAVESKKIDGFTSFESLMEEFDIQFEFPKLVTRDSLKWAQENNLWLMNGSISIAEGSRRAGTDPEQMKAEREEEMQAGLMTDRMMAVGGNMGAMNQNPDQLKKNDSAGSGTNKGDGGPVSHSDKVT